MRGKTAQADKVHPYDATAGHTAQSMRTPKLLIPKPPGLTKRCDALGSDDAPFLTLFKHRYRIYFQDFNLSRHFFFLLPSGRNMPLISF